MMRQLTVAAAFLLLSTANAASLRGAGDQGADKQAISWATPGQGSEPESVDMPRKQLFGTGNEQGSHPESVDMPRKSIEPQHRQLPPLSHGWSYEGGAGAGSNGRKEAVEAEKQQQQQGSGSTRPRDIARQEAQVAAAAEAGKQLFGAGDDQGSHPESVDMPRKQLEPEHRQLPPLSHGWSFEGGAGAGSNGRKDVINAQQPGEAEVDVPRKQIFGTGDDQGSHPESVDMPRKSIEPEHRQLPPLSHGWSYEGGAGAGSNGRKDVVDWQHPGDAEIDIPRKQIFGTGDEQGSHPESVDMPRKSVEPQQQQEGGKL